MIPLETPSTNITCKNDEHYQLFEQPLKDSTLCSSSCGNSSLITLRSNNVSSVNLSSLSLTSTSSSDTFQSFFTRDDYVTPSSYTDRSSFIHCQLSQSSGEVFSRKRAFEDLSVLAQNEALPDEEYSKACYPSTTTSRSFFPSPDTADDDGWGYYVDTPDS